MARELSSLLWGVFFNVSYCILVSLCTMIFRDSASLSTPVAFVALFVGETLGTVPLFPFAWRNWTVKSAKRWAIFILLGLLINFNFILWRACADVMPLGVFSAITGAGFFFTPALTALLHGKCVTFIDGCGIVAAMIGLVLVTHPPFLFDEPIDAPVYGYVFAVLQAGIILSFPYFFGATKDAHWSNFLVLRVICSTSVAAVCLAVAGGAEAFETASLVGLGDVFLVGVLSTIYRLSQQVGCYELEWFDAGLAGLLGSLINSGNIATTSLMSLAFFGETLTTLEGFGVAVIFVSIVVVIVAKGCAREKEKEDSLPLLDGGMGKDEANEIDVNESK